MDIVMEGAVLRLNWKGYRRHKKGIKLALDSGQGKEDDISKEKSKPKRKSKFTYISRDYDHHWRVIPFA